MRIIAGKYGGRKLVSPIGRDVRPTTDRIKESLFNILQFKIAGKTVLDLFAGSGALGIEAISRGANKVIFVDNNSKSVELLNKNLDNIEYNGELKFGDSIRFLNGTRERFDIVFLDPPYKSDLAQRAISIIADQKLLTEDGFITYEHDSNLEFKPNEGVMVFDSRNFGKTVIDFIKIV